MNYRHAFHAGNFADVHKHVVLVALLEHLRKKPAPFFVLDTHAGRGQYDLQSEEAVRSGEWQYGIGRVRALNPPLQPLEPYLELVGSTGHTYSGSPLIVAARLRENDRAVFIEQQSDEAAALKAALGKRKKTSILVQDGYAALRAQLPPKENRGLVFIDPPYESGTEFSDVAHALQIALTRWPNGIYCAWYPIKPDGAEQRLHRALVASGIKKLLSLELSIHPANSPLGLNGSGILLVNPPWELDTQMQALLPQLQRALAIENAGGARVKWLVNQ